MTELAPSITSLPHIPLPSNSSPSATLDEQAETEQLIKLLIDTIPPLDSTEPTVLRKAEHSAFLASSLFKLPAGYVALDASRPWLLFWTLHSIDLLGIAIDDNVKRR
jgi:protein farnesyltransferase subunit beta